MQLWQPEQISAGKMAHPGGRCTTTAKTPGLVSPEAMGTVSTHRVKEPHKWTCTVAVSGTHSTKHVQAKIAYDLAPKLPRESCGNKVCGHATSHNTSCAATISGTSPAQPVAVSRYSSIESTETTVLSIFHRVPLAGAITLSNGPHLTRSAHSKSSTSAAAILTVKVFFNLFVRI